MNRLALSSISLFFLGTPAFAADLDGPVYRERDTYFERPAPTVIERERIIEHHYYYAPRVETYVAPRVYERPVYGYRDAYYDDGYRYRRPAYFAAPPFWSHRHRGW